MKLQGAAADEIVEDYPALTARMVDLAASYIFTPGDH
ncbi:hypothetical protein HFO94_24595 [Rhizobium leguminosarum]|nr:uncharacterized protein (DUF433 family) [Rhizobium sp. BK456]MBY3031201.1 hypothetical protein [Rhizobium leguminosarum]MBY3271421.1 hypothetical protein [Rhizobium laguerreae]MBY3307486.1 hypothetical protein [Rhizobium laguerreae]MBY3397337.1 hypothetical protein [Rhizobium laguerreae]